MRKFRMVLAVIAALSLAGTLSAAGESGQVTFATVPVPGATVTASQGDKHIVTSTDAQGVYRFPDLSEGAWSIQVEMLGFEPATQDVAVSADAAPANIELKLLPFESVAGTVKPTPNVRAATLAGATTGSAPSATNRGNAPNGNAAAAGRGNAAPANAGSPANRATPPSAAGAPPAAAPPPANGGGSDINADGLLVNGSVNNGAASPFAQLAAFGNNRRGIRSLYNWNLGLLLGNSALDARQFSFTDTPTPKPSYTDAQMLGTFGGPVKIPGLKNRANVTLSYQHVSDHNVTTQTALMPTLAERSGDFSQAVDGFGNPVHLVNPQTGLPFAGNMIPAASIASQASSLLGYYPLPNVDGAGFNYEAPVLLTTHQDAVQSRVTDALNNKNSLFGNFNYQRTTTTSGNLFNFPDASRVSNIDAAINWSRRISLFASFRVGYHFTETSTATTPYFANVQNVSGLVGVSGNNQTPANWGPPTLVFSSGIAGLGSPQYASNHDLAHAWTAEATWSHNRHNFTYGGGLSLRHLDVFSQQNARGTITFGNASSTVGGASSGNDFADFLLGRASASSIAFGNADKFLRAPTFNAYVTDDWRLTPTFTANVGVRWEYEAPMTERDGRLVNLDIAPGFTDAKQVLASNPIGPLTGAHYPDSLVRPDRGGVQPRLAIAWRPIPGSSLVVRAGYGIYRNAQVYQSIAMLLAQQPPQSTTSSISSTPTTPILLASPFAPAASGLSNTFAVDPNLRVGYAQNWQVSVQRDLPASLTMNFTYLGTKGSHLMQEFLPNTYPIGAINPCPSCPVGFVYLASDGHSFRNAGQFQVRRRLRNGFTASVQYTLAKATDDATAFGGASTSGSSIAQNWLDLPAEQAPSNFDQRHQVAAQVQYSTGQGIGGGAMMTGFKGALIKGWTFTSQLTVGSGLPFTPIVLATVPGTGVTGTIRPSLTGTSTDATQDGSYLNPDGYTLPASGQWGNAGRNSARGPSQFSLNGGVGRSFLLSERLSLDWRFDATNLLNRLVYTSVTPLFGSPQFGLATQANQARKVQMVARLRF